MTTRAAINILGSTGEVIDVVSMGVETITTKHPSIGHYAVFGTLGMAPPPLGWGYVLNQMDAETKIKIEFDKDVLNVMAFKEGVPADLLHSITLHVAVDESPIPEIKEPVDTPVDYAGEALAEILRHRASADYAIAPLQDAVDIDEATDLEVLLLKEWKKYRVLLSRVPEQPGYPTVIDWPIAPA